MVQGRWLLDRAVSYATGSTAGGDPGTLRTLLRQSVTEGSQVLSWRPVTCSHRVRPDLEDYAYSVAGPEEGGPVPTI